MPEMFGIAYSGPILLVIYAIPTVLVVVSLKRLV